MNQPDRPPLTKQCTCKAEHWQPHADSCPAKVVRPLLTLENIRSGTVPSDAIAVGFLLGEIERLRGIQPQLPPRPPDGDRLPRYGIRWNGPNEPLAVPMEDGYWTPWHLTDKPSPVEPSAKVATPGASRTGEDSTLDESSRPRELLEDRAYYDGARQAAAIAHQSLIAMDKWINEGCGQRRPAVKSKAESVLDRKVTVCGACHCASCWQGEFYCEHAKTAGTVEMTIRELYQGNVREDSGYWFKNPNTGEVDYDAKSAAKRAWLASQSRTTAEGS